VVVVVEGLSSEQPLPRLVVAVAVGVLAVSPSVALAEMVGTGLPARTSPSVVVVAAVVEVRAGSSFSCVTRRHSAELYRRPAETVAMAEMAPELAPDAAVAAVAGLAEG
jgi:hypothetical protein